jgi:hypothetical protein
MTPPFSDWSAGTGTATMPKISPAISNEMSALDIRTSFPRPRAAPLVHTRCTPESNRPTGPSRIFDASRTLEK